MRELDELLSAWLQLRFDSATAAQRDAFQTLLALPDPQLQRYLLTEERPEQPDAASMVQAVLDAQRIMSSRRRGNLPRA